MGCPCLSSTVNDPETCGKFTGARIDGKPLTKDQEYAASPGSAIIELKPACLETLRVGEHALTAEFSDGKADAGFTILASAGVSLPQTGDSSNLPLFALIGLPARVGPGVMMKR